MSLHPQYDSRQCLLSLSLFRLRKSPTGTPVSIQMMPQHSNRLPCYFLRSIQESVPIPFFQQEGRVVRTFSQPKDVMQCGTCMAVCFLPVAATAKHRLMAGYEDGSIALWDVADAKHPRTVTRIHSEAVMALAAAVKSETQGANSDSLAF